MRVSVVFWSKRRRIDSAQASAGQSAPVTSSLPATTYLSTSLALSSCSVRILNSCRSQSSSPSSSSLSTPKVERAEGAFSSPLPIATQTLMLRAPTTPSRIHYNSSNESTTLGELPHRQEWPISPRRAIIIRAAHQLLMPCRSCAVPRTVSDEEEGASALGVEDPRVLVFPAPAWHQAMQGGYNQHQPFRRKPERTHLDHHLLERGQSERVGWCSLAVGNPPFPFGELPA